MAVDVSGAARSRSAVASRAHAQATPPTNRTSTVALARGAMNFLSSLSSAVLSAGSAALAGATNGVPGLPGFTLGERVPSFDGKSIWALYDGTKKVRASRPAVRGLV